MANKMLIDASHQEETRVVVVRGNRIEEFDFESEHKKQLKGNIYLAKVTRVEPSLQAAFVEYGGNRHGFLAFSEIHPDYYQIPKADRQALIEEELRRAQAEDDDHEEERPQRQRGRNRRASPARAASSDSEAISEEAPSEDVGSEGDEPTAERIDAAEAAALAPPAEGGEPAAIDVMDAAIVEEQSFESVEAKHAEPSADGDEGDDENENDDDGEDDGPEIEDAGRGASEGRGRRRRGRDRDRGRGGERREEEASEEAEEVDQVGQEDALEEVPVRQVRSRRQYKIQEVIKRRQILLVQVVKEERGNKGAALTTYLSLAGRYSVLMPNTARGGGISRKITNAADRKRLKEVARELEVPRGMGIILRTAGANRTKAEVKRDYEYLMRLWETVRSLTLASTAPALVYEEGSLIKRSIRDLYNKDIDQILVAGEEGYREAKDFMRMLMPSQSKVVQPYREPTPIFARQGIEAQLDKMLQPHVTLKSGGYIIINQTEALVAIDVNSGRSTREHSVEDTALQTNLEAAEEVARQLRLRDLAGLVVIDFIDMEEKRNNRAVEKRLKDCLKDDRARIQLGRISHFGLLEMSRQRIRASVLESTMQTCPVCGGAGHVRSASSLALHVLRSIEEHIQKHPSHDVIVNCSTESALYILNEKRGTISELERQSGLHILIRADETIGHSGLRIEQGAEAVRRPPVIEHVSPVSVIADEVEEEEDEAVVAHDAELEAEAEAEAAGELVDKDRSRRRSRRGRGRRRNGGSEADAAGEGESDVTIVEDEETEIEAEGEEAAAASDEDGDENGDGRGRRRRRRGRRGGRRGRDLAEENGDPLSDPYASTRATADSLVVVDAVRSDAEDAASDDESAEQGEGESAQVSITEPSRSFEPEMVDAVEAVEASDIADVAEEGSIAGSGPDVPDENEVIAASAEAGAAFDGNPPLDAVFPMEDGAGPLDEASQADVEVEAEEVSTAAPAPAPLPREPRLVSSDGENEAGEERPKRTGWWSRRFSS